MTESDGGLLSEGTDWRGGSKRYDLTACQPGGGIGCGSIQNLKKATLVVDAEADRTKGRGGWPGLAGHWPFRPGKVKGHPAGAATLLP
jgi:hypothetical protein